jgi:hypothetical protein
MWIDTDLTHRIFTLFRPKRCAACPTQAIFRPHSPPPAKTICQLHPTRSQLLIDLPSTPITLVVRKVWCTVNVGTRPLLRHLQAPAVAQVEHLSVLLSAHPPSPRDRSPSSPFAKQYDQIWAEFYLLGKSCGGNPGVPSIATAPSSHQNFPWAVLINPYTQDLERPNGAIDPEWVWKICDIALNCMQALVQMVCKRQGDWRKTICDVPAQVQHALMSFPDLQVRYDQLKRDAREAVAGGLPVGY